jgi:hypothetical protein
VAESHRTQKEVGCNATCICIAFGNTVRKRKFNSAATPTPPANCLSRTRTTHHTLAKKKKKKNCTTWQRSRMSYATALARAAPSVRHRQSPPRIDAASVGRQQPSRGSRPSPSSCPWLQRETRGVLRSQSSVLQQCAVRS